MPRQTSVNKIAEGIVQICLNQGHDTFYHEDAITHLGSVKCRRCRAVWYLSKGTGRWICGGSESEIIDDIIKRKKMFEILPESQVPKEIG